jgi:predicted  nucleic acid-binding Zn-ribbon protein
MEEEDRRLEVLKAEAAIRELAGRMAQAGESARQADNTRRVLETAVRSMDEFNTRFQELTESWENSFEEKNKSINQAKESLDTGAKDFQQAHERLEKMAENLETSMEEKNKKFYELIDFKLGSLSQDINTFSTKLLFIMDQNEALDKRIQALQGTIYELSWKFQDFGNDMASNSEDVQELRTKVIDSNERLSSLEQTLEAKTSGLSHRLRSALIGGGLGMVTILMVIKFV